MKAGRASKTAEAAAAIRANHHLNANDPVFSDPYAFEMTNSQWRLLLNNALLRKALNSNLMNQTFGKLDWTSGWTFSLYRRSFKASD